MRNPGGAHVKPVAIPLFLALLFLIPAGCGVLGKGELIRTQKQRSAANKYAGGGWMERRDAVREIVNYYGNNKNDLVIGTLLVAAKDASPTIRMEAVQGLAKIRTQGALDVIRRIASDEKENNVRWYALRALREMKDPSAAELFIRGARSDDWLIREESSRGMLALDDATVRTTCAPTIIRLMKDPSSSVALATLRGLKAKDPRFYQVITERFNSSGAFDYSMMEASLTALEGYRLDGKTKEKVINLLVHHATAIRLLALRVLKKEKNLADQEKQGQ